MLEIGKLIASALSLGHSPIQKQGKNRVGVGLS